MPRPFLPLAPSTTRPIGPIGALCMSDSPYPPAPIAARPVGSVGAICMAESPYVHPETSGQWPISSSRPI
ncbi:hypothetical protein PAXRUDRAFT_22146 [Paxillus rubicundulus Ve08.2h10]|uniref:Uncharacterized protein n=1 Tax=Paxillus rubicundulus Ve08.2h10 TaxID=930991 RepID=A0A0D0D5Z5_9AGAM|nr:hypothetical protein PAXRUDRAFT_22146 [Paxillus rubicundulus Ve08.2h10]